MASGKQAVGNQERELLIQVLEQEHAKDYPKLGLDDFFEIFSADYGLRRYGYYLDPAQIESGGMNTGQDVDSIFFFINRKLVRSDMKLADFSDQSANIELFIFQSKRKPSFEQVAITKLKDFTENCLSMNADRKSALKFYNKEIIEAVWQFKEFYKGLLKVKPSLTIRYCYMALGTEKNIAIQERLSQLEKKCKESYTLAQVKAECCGAVELWAEYNRKPPKELTLDVLRYTHASGFGSIAYFCLSTLNQFHKFITNGKFIRDHMFEANVRDHHPDAAVNKQISETLSSPSSEDFWWLNNGVTVIGTEVVPVGDSMSITDPLIVNGLQTSFTIFNYFSQTEDKKDDRIIGVKIIKSTKPEITDAIIKATNSQTKIPPIWLNATEPVHRNIEKELLKVGLYYDRRKNHARNQGAPVGSIVTIPELAQALAAIVLQKPDHARARPTTVAKTHYKDMFSETYPLALYSKVAQIYKKAGDYLDSRSLERSDRNNLIFYLAMTIPCVVLEHHRPDKPSIAGIDMDKVTDAVMKTALGIVRPSYNSLGGDAKVAKGSKLIARLNTKLAKKYSPQYKKKAK